MCVRGDGVALLGCRGAECQALVTTRVRSRARVQQREGVARLVVVTPANRLPAIPCPADSELVPHWSLVCARVRRGAVRATQALVTDYEKLKKKTLRIVQANPSDAETQILAPKVRAPPTIRAMAVRLAPCASRARTERERWAHGSAARGGVQLQAERCCSGLQHRGTTMACDDGLAAPS